MVTTIKVIFLGLIGFVPGPEEQDMAALLVNPAGAQCDKIRCHASEHLAMVVLLHGKCDPHFGTCYRIQDLKGRAEALHLDDILHPQEGDDVPGLVWLLKDEDLDISGDEDERLNFRNPMLAFTQGKAPRSSGQSSYFAWVPSMDELTSGHGQINANCRQANPYCPIDARFRLQGGEAGACHMFHDPEKSLSDKRDVRLFDYLIPGEQSVQQRAVADAAQIEFHEAGKYVILESESLPGRGDARVKALLKPDDYGRLTLIVANLPECPALEDEGHYRQYDDSPPHSDIFFQLLDDPAPPPIRVLNSKERRRVDPGSCEKDIEKFATIFARTCKREFPHTITACDGTRFPKPGQ